MIDSIFLGGGGPDHKSPQNLLLARANRHGLVAGATGTGKTVTLQVMAEQFSAAGVPVFCADVKGDLSGICVAATPTEYDDRTTPDGKTSSVHWLRFKLTPELIARFKTERVVLGIGHKNYGHMAVLSDDTRAALALDFG